MTFFGKVFYEQCILKLPYPSTPLDGKTVVVTGANTGLGLEVCRHAVRLNAATVVIASRNVEAGNAARDDILASVKDAKSDVRVVQLDQASFASVGKFIEEMKQLERVDVLILNAAVWMVGQWDRTEDGWERQLQVNTLSPAYIGLSLLGKMKKDATASGAKSELKPHIAFVTSDGHELFEFPYRVEENVLKYMNDEQVYKNGSFVDRDRYPATKLFNIYTAQKAAGYAGEEVIVNATNPGFTKTELFRSVSQVSVIGRWALWLFSLVLGRSAEDGSRNLCQAGFGCGDETQGKYLSACRVMPTGRWAQDTEEVTPLRNKIWKEIGEAIVPLDPELGKYFS